MQYEAILTQRKPGQPLTAEFLVLPGTSLMTYASTVEPLRAANRLAGRSIFDWRFLSRDGAPVPSSGGIPLPVSGRFDPGTPRDLVGIIAGFHAAAPQDRAMLRTVFRASRGAALTLGIESGAWLLARAGLLDGRAATTHWEDLEDFAAAFPLVDLRPDRFVTDGPFLTTSGASPTFDLMIEILHHRAGQALALEAAGLFNYEIAHRAGDRQSPVAFGQPDRFDPRLMRAVQIMQANIDAPLPIAAIARHVRLTSRGLELLFQRQLGQPPGRYYLSLRMGAARKLLLDTALPILEIASRTGFSSGAAFTRAYRRAYGMTPGNDRRGHVNG